LSADDKDFILAHFYHKFTLELTYISAISVASLTVIIPHFALCIGEFV
jgi:hypothetical protein